MVLVIQIFPQTGLITHLKCDWDPQSFRHEPRVRAFLVWNQIFEDLGVCPHAEVRPISSQDPLRAGCHCWRIESAAHEDAHAACSQPVCDGTIQKSPELFDTFAWSLVMDGGAHWQLPIAVHRNAVFVANKDMCGRQPLDICERSSSRFPDHVKEEKIRDGKIVQSPGDSGMYSNTIQRVTENKGFAKLRVVKRFNPKMIPRANQLPVPRVPDAKRKIPTQMIHASQTPRSVCVQDQLGIRSPGLRFAPALLKFL